jgi:hypothetical protein
LILAPGLSVEVRIREGTAARAAAGSLAHD